MILYFIDTSLTSFLTQVPPLDTGHYGNIINKTCLKGQRDHLQYCPKCWLSIGHWVGLVSQVWYYYKPDVNCYQQNLHVRTTSVAQVSSLTKSFNQCHTNTVQFYWPVFLVFIEVRCHWWCSLIVDDLQSFLSYCSGKGLNIIKFIINYCKLDCFVLWQSVINAPFKYMYY